MAAKLARERILTLRTVSAVQPQRSPGGRSPPPRRCGCRYHLCRWSPLSPPSSMMAMAMAMAMVATSLRVSLDVWNDDAAHPSTRPRGSYRRRPPRRPPPRRSCRRFHHHHRRRRRRRRVTTPRPRVVPLLQHSTDRAVHPAARTGTGSVVVVDRDHDAVHRVNESMMKWRIRWGGEDDATTEAARLGREEWCRQRRNIGGLRWSPIQC